LAITELDKQPTKTNPLRLDYWSGEKNAPRSLARRQQVQVASPSVSAFCSLEVGARRRGFGADQPTWRYDDGAMVMVITALPMLQTTYSFYTY
jgi:hypothetical protein